MKRLISLTMPLPSARKGMATVSSADKTGSGSKVTAGALEWVEMQIAQGEELRETAASECECAASSPVMTRARRMQLSATKRISFRRPS